MRHGFGDIQSKPVDARKFPVPHRHRGDGPGRHPPQTLWFSRDEISISITKVASVHIKTGILYSDILIESTGGSDPLASHGHRKADARRVRKLIEVAQGNLGVGEKLKLS